jgi:hypothetical protein
MEAKEYKRRALDSLRERARQRGIEVTGRKDEPRLLLMRSDGLLLSYQEDWWRSAFKRSGYGGAFIFESEADDPLIRPAIVLLINLGDFLIPMRSPENLKQVEYFIGRLVRLASWCIEEKLQEFRALASEPGTALSKVERAAKTLREFSNLPDARS